MQIVIPLEGRVRTVIRSSFVAAKRLTESQYTLSGDNFQMTGVTAEQVLILPDAVEVSEGQTVTDEMKMQALPFEGFIAVSTEDVLPNVLGLLLRSAVADGKLTDEELLSVQPALEGRVWQPGLSVQIGDVYSYAGFLWRCIQAHTTQTGWEPDKVPALWRKIEIIYEDTKRIWQADVDYALSDSVFYPDENGTEYVCITAHTSQTGWEPPNTPALWQKKTSTEAPQIALN